METFKALLIEEYAPAQWVLVFFLYSFAGWCWEVSVYLVRRHQLINRGFLTGPILPIYGFGALAILLVGVPLKAHLALVALSGMTVATLLEYVTGAAMEALFHVRYWDYSMRWLNIHGYVCLKSMAAWAFFSVMLVDIIHPLVRGYVLMVPNWLVDVLASAFLVLALIDTVIAVRRALDLRVLLESMERYARELEALHGKLDGISDRISEMIRTFALGASVKREEINARLARITEARERVKGMMREKKISLEEGARARFAAFERVLSDIADQIPDTGRLLSEIAAFKARYDSQSSALHAAREHRFKRILPMLRRNPDAVSKRYSASFAALRGESEREEQEKRGKTA